MDTECLLKCLVVVMAKSSCGTICLKQTQQKRCYPSSALAEIMRFFGINNNTNRAAADDRYVPKSDLDARKTKKWPLSVCAAR